MPNHAYIVNYQVKHTNPVNSIEAVMPYLLQLHPAVQVVLIIVAVLVLYYIIKLALNIAFVFFLVIIRLLGLW